MSESTSSGSSAHATPYTWNDLGGFTLDGDTHAWDDVFGTDYTLQVTSTLTLAEDRAMVAGKTVSEVLALAESFDRQVQFQRFFAEAFSVSSDWMRAYGLNVSEGLSISERFRRNAQAILSDLLFAPGDMDDTAFADLFSVATAAGFEPFQSFMEGDAQYQKALMKARVTSDSSTRIRVLGLQHDVDVPDVFDSGTVSLSSGGSTVTFNRQFYVNPEINVVLKGGTQFAVPRVRNITLTNFVVECFDKDGNSMAGLVSWAAHGY